MIETEIEAGIEAEVEVEIEIPPITLQEIRTHIVKKNHLEYSPAIFSTIPQI